MQREIRIEELAGNVCFLGVSDKMRKTNRITVAIVVPLAQSTVSEYAVLPYVLKRSCREYPDFTALNEKLSMLYGASLDARVSKLGENQILTISISSIDDRYSLGDEKIASECASLLASMLFDPALENEVFREKDVKVEKRLLHERIEAEINDKRQYAKKRAVEIMCENEAFGIDRLGSAEGADNLTAEKITAAWHNVLSNAPIVVTVLGPADPEPVIKEIKERFEKFKRAARPIKKTEVVLETDEVKNVVERMDVTQAKLVLGFRAGIAEPDKEVNAMRLMTALFGGTPHSRLFMNVREKMSLCYYCAARYDAIKGIITVDCGLEEQNAEKARQEILNQLEIIKNGEFEDSELEAAKMSYVNSVKSVRNSLTELEAWYLNQILNRTIDTPEERAEKINSVTRQDVIDAANKLKLDTVYLLAGKEADA